MPSPFKITNFNLKNISFLFIVVSSDYETNKIPFIENDDRYLKKIISHVYIVLYLVGIL